VFASPELSHEDFVAFAAQSPLPAGVILSGHVPLVIARTLTDDLKPNMPFKSPKGEESWVARYGDDYWIYPNWALDLTRQKDDLFRAGYRLFVHLDEPVPRTVTLRSRPGKWNWDLTLL
jgi:putative protease